MMKITRKMKLYIGTSEKIAKSAPVNGVKCYLPVALCTTNPAYFANIVDDRKWGIIQVSLGKLNHKLLSAYSRVVSSKLGWRRSLEKVGICLYSGDIQKEAIEKIMIFDIESNNFVKNLIISNNTKADSNVAQCTLKWLMGEPCTAVDLFGEDLSKEQKSKIDSQLFNKMGLDVFYAAPVDKKK